MMARRCLVEGRVQGVFFRATTQRKANELAVTGYAKNLPDGRVEVWAEGVAANVDELCAWLWHGPDMANVSRVDCEIATPKNFTEFTTA